MNNNHQNAPDTREIFCWFGKDPHTDLIRLTDAVAARTRAELFRVEGNLCRLHEGRFVTVDKRAMVAIVAKHLKTFRWVNRGDDNNPAWEIEFVSFGFLPDTNPSYGPNEQALMNLMTALIPKVASGPTKPNDFSNHDMREILGRLRQGDPPRLIAHRFGVEVDVIQEIDRAAR
jgi:hypothetical protein